MQPEPNLPELKSKKVDKDQLKNSSQGQASSCEGFLHGVVPFSRNKPECTRSLHVLRLLKQNKKAGKENSKVTWNQSTRTWQLGLFALTRETIPGVPPLFLLLHPGVKPNLLCKAPRTEARGG